jgi:4-amino-4-deoxy-L-arabinose transferase-like glycosyltransferase
MSALSPPTDSVSRESWLAPALIALAALLLVRIGGLLLARTDLFFDEAQYWTWAQELAFGYFSKPPLIAWVIRATTSVCGNGEACVRLGAPLIHLGTSLALYAVAERLYGRRIGAAAALVFATLPGVSFSAAQISTDVPLLLFWSLALLGWVETLRTGRLGWAALLGLAFGLGFLSKYAMGFFVLCAAIHLAASPAARRSVRAAPLVLAALIAAAMVAPHLLWNVGHGFVTLAHTADNAAWSGSLFHPGRLLEFLGAQFGVFGPILFAALVAIAWRALRRGADENERFLLAFSLPILLAISAQALLSRAHANWAAAAYPAATILVTATLLGGGWRKLFATSLALHSVVAVAIAFGPAFAPMLRLKGLDPYGRLLGWRDTAALVRAELARGPYQAVLSDDRALAAELLYYLRDDFSAGAPPLQAWRRSERPRDHYELTRPFLGAAGPVLLVTLRPEAEGVTQRFASAEQVATQTVAEGSRRPRIVTLYRLDGFRGPTP